MPTCELEDSLVEGTGPYMGYFPPDSIRGKVTPRVSPTSIKQRKCETREGFLDAYEFVGKPVDEERLQHIRQERGLSKNYGAVLIPKSMLRGVAPESTRLIVGDIGEDYIIAGLLPTKTLRWDARRILSDGEGIVFAVQNEFPTLSPQELMARDGAEK